MLDNGADIEAGDWDTPWRKEIETDGSEREVKRFGGAPLMLATLKEDHGMMRELLTAGADLEARTSVTDFVRDTTLHLATNYGEEPKMRILIETGAEVHAGIEDRGQFEKLARMTILRKNLDVYGTALEIAVWKDDAAKVGLLLDYGADPGAEVFFNDEDHEIESSCLHTERSGGNLSISVGHNPIPGSRRTDISLDFDYVESELVCADEVEDLDKIDDMYHDQTIAIWDSDICIGPAFDGKLPPDEIMEEWEHTTKAIRKMKYSISRLVEPSRR